MKKYKIVGNKPNKDYTRKTLTIKRLSDGKTFSTRYDPYAGDSGYGRMDALNDLLKYAQL